MQCWKCFLITHKKRQTLGQCYRKGSFKTSDNLSVCIKSYFMHFLCSDLHIKANILCFVGFCLIFYALACAIYLYKPWWCGSGASVIFCITFVINRYKILFDGFGGVLAVLFASVNWSLRTWENITCEMRGKRLNLGEWLGVQGQSSQAQFSKFFHYWMLYCHEEP